MKNIKILKRPEGSFVSIYEMETFFRICPYNDLYVVECTSDFVYLNKRVLKVGNGFCLTNPKYPFGGDTTLSKNISNVGETVRDFYSNLSTLDYNIGVSPKFEGNGYNNHYIFADETMANAYYEFVLYKKVELQSYSPFTYLIVMFD